MFIYFQLKVLSERYEKTSENPSTRTRIRICLFYVFQSGDIRFPTQKRTFPVRGTYSFALRNIEYGQIISSHSPDIFSITEYPSGFRSNSSASFHHTFLFLHFRSFVFFRNFTLDFTA